MTGPRILIVILAIGVAAAMCACDPNWNGCEERDPAGNDDNTSEADDNQSGSEPGSSPCRSQCELAAGQCVEQPLESFPSYADQLERWHSEEDSERCQAGQVERYAAQCTHDRPVLVEVTGEVSYYYFYDASTGAFAGLRSTTDVLDCPCNGVGYWPEVLECDDPVITEVLCNESYGKVGDALALPMVRHP